MDSYNEKKWSNKSLANVEKKRWKNNENDTKMRVSKEGVQRGVSKALKRPLVRGETPMETSRVEKSREKKSK